MFFVGVGSAEAAAEFAGQLGINPALCLVTMVEQLATRSGSTRV